MAKSLIRSLNRRGTRSEKSPLAGLPRRTPPATACYGCGSMFARKTWRHDHAVTERLYDSVRWRLCPACRQTARGDALGKVVIESPGSNEDAIRRRVANVAARASVTQPQRRVIELERVRGTLEVLTTSQKLAHRLAREVEKAFGGRATYAWSDDGSLRAVWSPAGGSGAGTRSAVRATRRARS